MKIPGATPSVRATTRGHISAAQNAGAGWCLWAGKRQCGTRHAPFTGLRGPHGPFRSSLRHTNASQAAACPECHCARQTAPYRKTIIFLEAYAQCRGLSMHVSMHWREPTCTAQDHHLRQEPGQPGSAVRRDRFRTAGWGRVGRQRWSSGCPRQECQTPMIRICTGLLLLVRRLLG